MLCKDFNSARMALIASASRLQIPSRKFLVLSKKLGCRGSLYIDLPPSHDPVSDIQISSFPKLQHIRSSSTMKFQLLQLSLASGALGGLLSGFLGKSGVLDKRACNPNNCARAVTGTRYAAAVQAQHTADCSSFMSQTITPATP